MKTKKFFMLLAAVLLMSASAMAQSSEPVRGDLNGDGEVGMPDVMYLVQKITTGQFPDEVTVVTNKWFKGDTDPATLTSVGQTKTGFDTWTTATSILNTIVALDDDELEEHVWYFAFPQSWNVTTMLSSDNYTPVMEQQYKVTNNVNIGGSPFTVFKMRSPTTGIGAYFR